MDRKVTCIYGGLVSAIVFSNTNLEEEGHILYAPIYMVMCIEEQKIIDTIYSIEI